MSQISSKDLLKHLSSLKEDVPVKIYCSYNQYDLKRIVLYDNSLILEVGETNNFQEDFDSPQIA